MSSAARSLFTDRDCPRCHSSDIHTTDLADGAFLSVCNTCYWLTGCDDSVDLRSNGNDANRWVLEPYEGGPCLGGGDHCPVCIGFNEVGLVVSQCRICQKQGIVHYNGSDTNNTETLDDALFGAVQRMLGVDPKDPEFLERPFSVSEAATEEGGRDSATPVDDTDRRLLIPKDFDIVCDCGNNANECYEEIVDAFGEPTRLRCFQCDALFCRDNEEDSCTPSYVVCEKCGNTNEAVFEKTHDSRGHLVGVKCLNCGAKVRLGKATETKKKEKKKFYDSDYIHKARISSWDQLEHGNHISWQRPFSYEHHAIVDSVDSNGSRLRVIEYGSSFVSAAGAKPSLGCVLEREEKVEDLDAVFLYRYDYDPENCFTPSEVVERARRRIGERAYNVISKNCEHFATWCKTGREFCSQLVPASKRALHAVIAFLNQLAKPAIDLIRQEFFQVIAAGASVDDVIGLAAENLVKLDRAFFAGRIGGTILLNLLVELTVFCRRYARLKEDLDRGMVDKKEFRKQVFELGGESIGGLLLGLLLGFSWILLGPGLSMTVLTLVLNILGIVGGRLLGAWLGRKLHERLTSGDE